MLVALGVAVLTTVSFSTFSDKVSAKKKVFGVWVEQDVASYSAHEISIGKGGISINGRLVATQFRFDGDVLIYQTGEGEFKYRMLDEENTEMMLVSDEPYNPKYRLLEKHKNHFR